MVVIKKVAWAVVLSIAFCGALVVAVSHAKSTTNHEARIKHP